MTHASEEKGFSGVQSRQKMKSDGIFPSAIILGSFRPLVNCGISDERHGARRGITAAKFDLLAGARSHL